MATEAKVQGPASYFPSIEKKYGHPVEHWFGILQAAGEGKHMELVALLKSEEHRVRSCLLLPSSRQPTHPCR